MPPERPNMAQLRFRIEELNREIEDLQASISKLKDKKAEIAWYLYNKVRYDERGKKITYADLAHILGVGETRVRELLIRHEIAQVRDELAKHEEVGEPVPDHLQERFDGLMARMKRLKGDLWGRRGSGNRGPGVGVV